jgi:hypothetical protein
LKIRDTKSSFYPDHKGVRRLHILSTGLVLVFLFLIGTVNAQDQNINEGEKGFFSHNPHSAKKAMIYSAILPGLGQAYNKKYWKIPIVYAGLGVAGYFIKTYHDYYLLYKSDYLLLEEDKDAITETGLSQAQLKVLIDDSRRLRDLSIIGMFVWYGLGIIDANVDGHFYNYDINEDLSLQIDPWLTEAGAMNQGVGVSINLRWR